MATVAVSNASALRTVKLVHTVIWAVFAGCILAIPVATWMREFRAAFVLVAVVMVEVAVLAANGMSCPLTAVAARHTTDRRANFDIYLPHWLAKYNKQIFGGIYAAGLVFLILRWTEVI